MPPISSDTDTNVTQVLFTKGLGTVQKGQDQTTISKVRCWASVPYNASKGSPCTHCSPARTVRRWVDDFVANNGEFSDSQQGHYTIRNNTLMSNEEICEQARVYVRENAAPRGRPNLTARAFCHWVYFQTPPLTQVTPAGCL